jgi:HK97 family phage prohead protease
MATTRDLPAELLGERRTLTPKLVEAALNLHRELVLPEVRLSDGAKAAVDGAGAPIGFRGHAAVFDSPTWIGPAAWGFQEQVARGAFTKTIGEHDVRFLVDHDPSKLLARNKSGTMRLAEDKVGLAADADLAPTQLGRDVAVLLERGDLSQMSFGFQTVRDKWEEVDGTEGNKFERRTLLEVKLFDVSVVTFPAYEDTDAALRQVGLALLHRDLDPDLRDQLITGLRDHADLTPVVRAARTALGEHRTQLVEAVDQVVGDPPAPAPEPAPAVDPTPLELWASHARGEHARAGLRACAACGYDAAPPAAA